MQSLLQGPNSGFAAQKQPQKFLTHEHGHVPIKLYLQKQVLGQIWPASPSLWIFVLEHWSPRFVSPLPISLCSCQPYSQVPGMFLMKTLFPHFAVWQCTEASPSASRSSIKFNKDLVTSYWVYVQCLEAVSSHFNLYNTLMKWVFSLTLFDKWKKKKKKEIDTWLNLFNVIPATDGKGKDLNSGSLAPDQFLYLPQTTMSPICPSPNKSNLVFLLLLLHLLVP